LPAAGESLERTATFDYRGQAVEVTYVAPGWRVRVGTQEAESRRLDEALEATLGKSAKVANLVVEVLAWAHSAATD
jgi:hypothetical protein